MSVKIVTIVGARPNFVKLAPIAWVLREKPGVEHVIIHTGQHYDLRLSESFFQTLDIPQPDINLGVGSGLHGAQTGRMMIELEPVIKELNPDWVVTFGDVNSTLATTLVSSKIGIKSAHVESGLRSYDRNMPEEVNRVVADALSDVLFVTEQSGMDNLLREGVDSSKMHFVGNVMIDTLVKMLPVAGKLAEWERYGLTPTNYIVITLHRPSNVDDPGQLRDLCHAFEVISRHIPIVMPLHPRTRAKLEESGVWIGQTAPMNIKLIDPIDYLAFLSLVSKSKMVITDSGGIQEETTYLGIPCMTIRPNTERPVTVELGTNELVTPTSQVILKAFDQFRQDNWKKGSIPPLWDGHAAERILDVLLDIGPQEGSFKA